MPSKSSSANINHKTLSLILQPQRRLTRPWDSESVELDISPDMEHTADEVRLTPTALPLERKHTARKLGEVPIGGFDESDSEMSRPTTPCALFETSSNHHSRGSLWRSATTGSKLSWIGASLKRRGSASTVDVEKRAPEASHGEPRRVLNVKRARKMVQMFGSEPPLTLFQLTPDPDASTMTSPVSCDVEVDDLSDLESNAFQARRLRAAKLSRFFGVAYNDLSTPEPSQPTPLAMSAVIQTNESYRRSVGRMLRMADDDTEVDMEDVLAKLRRMKAAT